MISQILILLGSIFFLIASLGLLRLPDPFARLHAGTKAASLGVLLLLLAAALRFHDAGSLMLIGSTLLLVFLTAPLGGHAIARRLLAREQKAAAGKADGDRRDG
ncbi:MAG: monovalent cation/H(+) antiporter subunit G [Verrucomicrobiota bacterium]